MDRVLIEVPGKVSAKVRLDMHCRSLTSLLNRSDELMRLKNQV